MPKLEYFVVCESIAVDRETNRVSLFNILEDIQPVTGDFVGPIISPQMVVVSAWNKETGDDGQDFQAIMRVHPPGAEHADFPINFVMDRPRKRLILRVQGPPAKQAGDLRFELRLNDRHVATHTVTVHPPIKKPAAPPEEASLPADASAAPA
jgi:hypothetical protein